MAADGTKATVVRLAGVGLRDGAADEYALFRDGWMQRRNYQINEDSREERGADQELPDYLREDEDEQRNPTVPADAMPLPIPLPGA